MISNICVREAHEDKEGNEKVSWNVVGTLIDASNGKRYVKLFHIPGVLCNVFEQKKKEDKTQAAEPQEAPQEEPQEVDNIAWDE